MTLAQNLDRGDANAVTAKGAVGWSALGMNCSFSVTDGIQAV